jgi:hypothetical protein
VTQRTRPARQQELWNAVRVALWYANDRYLLTAMTVEDDSEDQIFGWARQVGHHANRALDLLKELSGDVDS